jgi:hypothetical protein
MLKQLERISNELIRTEQGFDQLLDLLRDLYHAEALDPEYLELVEDLFEALEQDL